MKNKYIFIIVIIFICISICNCGKVQLNKETINIEENNFEEAIEENSLNINIDGEPLDINPITSTDKLSKFIILNTQEGLFYKKDNKIQNGLVEKYEISENQLEYTFYLKNARWSDGKEITSEDIKNSWINVLKSESAAYNSYKLYNIRNAEKYAKGILNDEAKIGIDIIDDKIIKVTLEHENNNFIDDLTLFVFYPYRNDNIFSGPYVIDSWTHNEKIVLKSNLEYRNYNKNSIEHINISMMTGNIKPVNEFAKGNLDISTISLKEKYRYKDQEELKIILNDSVYALVFNFNNKTINNIHFRNSIQNYFPYEIFRNEIVKSDTPEIKGFNSLDNNEEKYKTKQQEKSNARKNIELKMIYNNEFVPNKLAAIIQQIVYNLGYDVNIKMMSESLYYDALSNSKFDMAIIKLKSSYINNWGYLESFYSKSLNNYYNLVDSDIDKAYEINTQESAIRAEVLIKANAYAIPLSYGANYFLVNSELEDVEFLNDGILYLGNIKHN